MNKRKRSPSNLGLAVLLDENPTDATMKDYVFSLLLIAPLVLPGVITVLRSSSPWVILWVVPLVVLSAIIGGVLFLLSGTGWLQFLAPATFESQGGGISYIALWVPLLVYSGCVAGAWLVAFSIGTTAGYPGGLLFQAIAVLVTSGLGGLLPLTLLAFPQMLVIPNDALTGPVIVAIGNALMSAWLGSQLVRWLAHIF